MTKDEIIQAVAYAVVPEGTQLVEKSDPVSGLTMSRFDGENTGGMAIILARLFADQLTGHVISCDKVSEEFFASLHTALVVVSKETIDDLYYGIAPEALVPVAIEEHKKRVQCLRNIARQLGISYREPRDPYLE